MGGLRFARIGGLTLCLLAGLAACDRDIKPEQLQEMGPEQMYRSAQADMDAGRTARAANRWGEIERLHPYSEFAKRGLIMSAFAHHEDGKFEESRTAGQRFLEFYPADKDAAYAQYLIALSYYDQIDVIGRDQGLTFEALSELRKVIEFYPETEYARTARLKFDLAFNHLAGKEMEIGRYYLKQGHYPAAVNRFRTVVEDFQTTTFTPEALHRLVESYLALGLYGEAQTAGAILGHNFQGNPFYVDSFNLLQGRGLVPEARSDDWLGTIYRRTVKGEWL